MEEFILNTVIPWLISFVQNNPNVAPIFTVIVMIQGVARLILKPIMVGIKAFVAETESKEDDKKLEEVMQTKWYKVIAFIFDYILSLKLPTK